MSNYWFDKELDTLSDRPQDPYIVDEEQKALFREQVYPYWQGKTVIEHWLKRVPADTRALGYETGVIDVEIKTESGPGEIAPGYGEILLPKGWGGVRRWAEERLAALDPADPASEDKRYFLEAVVISCEAMGILARRHAEAARELAQTSPPERAAELERVAAACDWIAEEPPRTFHEALQLIWFAQMSLMMELNAPSYSPNRMDQYLVPLLRGGRRRRRADARRGAGAARVPVGQVRRAVLAAQRQLLRSTSPATRAFHNVTAGGVKADGEDATNDVSYMMLQATMDVRLNSALAGGAPAPQLPGGVPAQGLRALAPGHRVPGDPQRRGRDQGAAAQGRDHRGGARLVPRRLRRAQPARQAPPVERLRALQLRLGRRVRAVQRRAPAERPQARPRDRRPERLRDLRGVRGGGDGAARRASSATSPSRGT